MLHVLNMQFDVRKLEYEKIDIEGNHFNLAQKYKVYLASIDPNNYFIELRMVIKNTKENPVPFNMNVEVRLVYTFDGIIDNDESKKEVIDFLRTTGIRTLYPYFRSIVTNLSTSAMINQIVLPSIDGRDLFQDEQIEFSI